MKSRLLILLLFGIAVCIGLIWWLMRPTANSLAAAPGEVIVFGFVKKQGKQAWQPGMTVEDVISAAGGLAQFAVEKDIRVLNDWIPEPRYKGVLRSLHTKLEPVEDFMNDTWDWMSLPGSSPGFGWMRSSKGQRATVNLNTATAKTELLPGDVIIVRTKHINF